MNDQERLLALLCQILEDELNLTGQDVYDKVREYAIDYGYGDTDELLDNILSGLSVVYPDSYFGSITH